MSRTAYTLLFLYILTKPFYLFDSGLPQVADFIAVMLFTITVFSRGNLSRDDVILLSVYMVFCVYSLFIGLYYYLYFGDLRTGKAGIFYIFNALVLYAVLKMGKDGKRFINGLMAFIVTACAFQFLLSFAVESEAKRQTLFMNNPNQFAYWGLLSATMYCICAKQLGVRVVLQILTWVVFCYLILLGLSKAATISLFVLAAVHFFRSAKHVFLFAVLAGLILAAAQGTEIIDNITHRLGSIGEQEDDSILGRGYDRILGYPQYLLFGAGEFALERFPGAVHEIHSTVGTVVFSYGLIGTSILGTFIWLLYRRAGIALILYVLPAFVYGGVHNGLRFTFFWMMFGLVAVVSAGNPERQKARPVPELAKPA